MWLYFADPKLLEGRAYTMRVKKARDWVGLRTVAMSRNTIIKDGNKNIEVRYFISSLALDVTENARAIRGYWMVESYH